MGLLSFCCCVFIDQPDRLPWPSEFHHGRPRAAAAALRKSIPVARVLTGCFPGSLVYKMDQEARTLFFSREITSQTTAPPNTAVIKDCSHFLLMVQVCFELENIFQEND